MEKSLRKNVLKMVQDGITPSVVFYVNSNSNILFHEAFEEIQYQNKDIQPVVKNTIYDIASVTKIITATAALILLDRKKISLDDKIINFFPSCAYGKEVTVRHLLTHTSGIAIQMSKLDKLGKKELMHQAILQAPLASKPGTTVMFTNVNSYLLGKIIESVSMQSLDSFFKKELFIPLGMDDTAFNPPKDVWNRIVPTEITPERGVIHGEVHDESAFALGGVVGHAGLFSTADDLNSFCDLWINEGNYNGHHFFDKSLAREAVENQVAQTEPATGFGWMLNREWMGKFGPSSFGHTAFTGPSIMVNPDHKLAVILLTNRTYPHRTDKDRHAYQARIMDELFLTIGKKDK